MSPGAILALSLTAFLTSPAAVILLWILHRQTAERTVRDLAFAILGSSFVLLGNLLTALVESSARPIPYGIYVLLLDEVTIATLMTGGFACRFAHGATRLPVSPAARIAFWSWAFVLHALALAAVLLPGPRGETNDVSGGYFFATTGAVLMQIYATVVIVARRRRIGADFFVPRIARFVLLILPLGLLAAANDLFQLGRRLGGAGIPFSPFYTILINGVIITVIGRRLVAAGAASPAVDATHAEYGLTLRESEILPLLLAGASNEEIGEKLHISPHTVKNHVTVIYRKTGAESRFDLLRLYRQ